MDNKIWTEPLIQVMADWTSHKSKGGLNHWYLTFYRLLSQLFLTYGNQLANQVWAPAVPATEQLRPESSDEERLKFIQDKYSKGRYRRVHTLTSTHSQMNQVWLSYFYRLVFVNEIHCVKIFTSNQKHMNHIFMYIFSTFISEFRKKISFPTWPIGYRQNVNADI